MNRRLSALVASILSMSLLSVSAPPAKACAPDLAYGVLINGNHPDLPLKLFAGGNVGVIQPGWAKSYFVVAYRYLSDKPLQSDEQSSVVSLWHRRLTNPFYNTSNVIDERDAYLKLRAKAIKADPKKYMDLSYKIDQHCFKHHIGDSAMKQARLTLQTLLTKYQPGSVQLKEWVKAQDGIVGIIGKDVVVPNALPSNTDSILRDARTYQTGAANFYLLNYDIALENFRKLGSSSDKSLKDTASYMVLRTQAAKVRLEGKDENDNCAKLLAKAAQQAASRSAREDILELLRAISYIGKNDTEAIQLLSSYLTEGTGQRFGGDVGDLTFLLDGNPLHPESQSTDDEGKVAVNPSTDLSDWIFTIQDPMDFGYGEDTPEAKAKAATAKNKRKQHALEMWRQKHTMPWLVAAISLNGLRGEREQDLLTAAGKVPASSAGYLTCQFYIADALLAKNQKADARKLAGNILAKPNLPPTTRNLFSKQLAAASETSADYLRYSILQVPEVLYAVGDVVTPKFMKVEATSTFGQEAYGFDENVAKDISRNAPLKSWIELSRNKNIPTKFRAVLIRAAWTRAELLHRDELALSLVDELASLSPLLSPAVARYKKATAGPGRRFAAASLVLRNFGFTPYLTGGVERHAEAVNEFDWYNNNFWVPLPLVSSKKTDEDFGGYNVTASFIGSEDFRARMKAYDDDKLTDRLTATEKREADSERAAIWKNHPSRFYGQAVLDWAKLHPDDPDIPEMLYKINKLPKWSEITDVGSEYSRKAYTLLHSKYAGNKWTKKAVCYY